MQSRAVIALAGIPGSGKTAIAAALRKVMLEPAEFIEVRDEWHMTWKAGPADIIVFVEANDASGLQERMREEAVKFADKLSMPLIFFKNINTDLNLNATILHSYILQKITAHKNYPAEKRQEWEREFADFRDDGHFTWAMMDPMPLQMFFDKTREKSIPLSIESITSMIARCIENNLDENVLKQILEFSKSMNITGDLYLRRVKNVNYLILAASYGFHDPELTKRIITMQREARKQEPPSSSFAGRKPGDSTEYYSYRHAMYFVRYNPLHRLDLFKHANWGGCNWQAYVDLTGDEIPKEVCQQIKRPPP